MQHLAIRCPWQERDSAMGDVVQVYSGRQGRAMVFTSTKQEANELVQSSNLKQVRWDKGKEKEEGDEREREEDGEREKEEEEEGNVEGAFHIAP